MKLLCGHQADFVRQQLELPVIYWEDLVSLGAAKVPTETINQYFCASGDELRESVLIHAAAVKEGVHLKLYNDGVTELGLRCEELFGHPMSRDVKAAFMLALRQRVIAEGLPVYCGLH